MRPPLFFCTFLSAALLAPFQPFSPITMAFGESKTFVAAALRVSFFSSAFPFFSNIDEDLQFDLIMQYSDAQIPRSFDRLKEETLNWIVPYASPEFLVDRIVLLSEHNWFQL